MARTVKRAFKYRFYPTDAQAAQLAQTFGCVRKVYNLALAARTEAWTRQERLTYNATSAMLTAWKKTDELAFLNEVSCVPLQQSLRHLQTAFTNFWTKHTKYPAFKSKRKSRRSAEYTTSGFRYRHGALTLAKMAEPLDIAWSRPLPDSAQPSTVTVSQDAAGRWFVSLLCEDVIPETTARARSGLTSGSTVCSPSPPGRRSLTPDMSAGTGPRSPRPNVNSPESRRAPTNRAKSRLKVARIHARIADRRRDHLHKLTTRLVRENQTLVIEDLTVRNMVKNRSLARAISDAAWRQFRTMLEYKTTWHGRNLIVVDRWFPSSKLCSACGVLAETMPLSIREWTCRCGTTHDRDVNAAVNILAAGLAVTACGAGVRPQRAHARTRQTVSKQENPSASKGIPAL